MFAIKNKNIFLISGLILVLASWVCVLVFGLKPSIDFSGGSLAEYSFIERPEPQVVQSTLLNHGYESVSVRPAGEQNLIIRMKEVDADEQVVITNLLGDGVTLERFNTVGPLAGEALFKKVIIAVILGVITIMFFVMFSFRKVSEPVPSSRYAFATILALLHDISVPIGVFALLGYFFGIEVDLLFVTAMLAILGYSVNDTIVVFDRIRENLLQGMRQNETFERLVGRSLEETLARSINTSLTLVFTLVVLLVISTETVRTFVLSLLIGIVAGTYSSIFLASSLLVVFGGKKIK